MQQVININFAFVVKDCFDFLAEACLEINTAEMEEEKNITESRLFSQPNIFLYSNCGTLLIFFLSLLVFPYCVWPKGSFSTELAETRGQRQKKLGRTLFFKIFSQHLP